LAAHENGVAGHGDQEHWRKPIIIQPFTHNRIVFNGLVLPDAACAPDAAGSMSATAPGCVKTQKTKDTPNQLTYCRIRRSGALGNYPLCFGDFRIRPILSLGLTSVLPFSGLLNGSNRV
jgi:hypothetical protein